MATSQPVTSSTPDDAQHLPQEDAKVRGAEILISAVLRGGVFLSGGVTLLGVIIFFIQQRGQKLGDVTKVRYPHTLGDVFSGVGHGSGIAITVFGLLLLIATPVTRIAVSIVAFANERDWRYVGITSLVLLILLISFLLGKAG